MLEDKKFDYYEFLQISPNADSETIHRVYRFLAARFHPDNPVSGDPEKFFQLKQAYDVLSDHDRRAAFDSEYHQRVDERTEEAPLSKSVDFMDQVQGELNRRLAVLAVLYERRRINPYSPEVSLAEIEKRMGFPRDYLDFTTWYLTKRGYITRADNSDFTLTVDGADFVETQRASIPALNKLLTSGHVSDVVEGEGDGLHNGSDPSPIITLPDNTRIRDRRKTKRDRRVSDARSHRNELRADSSEHAALDVDSQPVSEPGSDPLPNPIPDSTAPVPAHQIQ